MLQNILRNNSPEGWQGRVGGSLPPKPSINNGGKKMMCENGCGEVGHNDGLCDGCYRQEWVY